MHRTLSGLLGLEGAISGKEASNDGRWSGHKTALALLPVRSIRLQLPG